MCIGSWSSSWYTDTEHCSSSCHGSTVRAHSASRLQRIGTWSQNDAQAVGAAAASRPLRTAHTGSKDVLWACVCYESPTDPISHYLVHPDRRLPVEGWRRSFCTGSWPLPLPRIYLSACKPWQAGWSFHNVKPDRQGSRWWWVQNGCFWSLRILNYQERSLPVCPQKSGWHFLQNVQNLPFADS